MKVGELAARFSTSYTSHSLPKPPLTSIINITFQPPTPDLYSKSHTFLPFLEKLLKCREKNLRRNIFHKNEVH